MEGGDLPQSRLYEDATFLETQEEAQRPKLRVGDAKNRVELCMRELHREGSLIFSHEKIFEQT